MSEQTAPKRYKLLGADGTTYLSEHKGLLGGYRRGSMKLYGRLDCKSALGFIAKGQYVPFRVFFADEATAIDAGHRPCAKCMPADYARWKANQSS